MIKKKFLWHCVCVLICVQAKDFSPPSVSTTPGFRYEVLDFQKGPVPVNYTVDDGARAGRENPTLHMCADNQL